MNTSNTSQVLLHLIGLEGVNKVYRTCPINSPCCTHGMDEQVAARAWRNCKPLSLPCDQAHRVDLNMRTTKRVA
jgi:hypothetical protein